MFNLLGLLLAISAVASGADQASSSPHTPIVYIAHRNAFRAGVPCEDGHLITAYLLPNDRVRLKVWLNNEEFNVSELETHLDAAFKTRAVWLLLIGADPRVPFGAVTEANKLAQRHVDYVAFITPSTEDATGCMSVSLPVGFKDHSR